MNFLYRKIATVVVNYIVDQSNVFKFVDSLNEKYNSNCIPLYGDITNASDIDNIIARLRRHLRKVDILVNNAGYGLLNMLRI